MRIGSFVKIDRDLAAALGAEAVDVTNAGRYRAADGREVDISAAISAAVDSTVCYPPEQRVDVPSPRFSETRFSVENDDTLSAARRLVAAGHRVAALNFASAKNPGGGFLNGARAQEEALCRSSALYACLVGREMYAWHRARRDALYGHWVIYSPDVPVFRGPDHALLAEPFAVSFLTSPAVNAKVVLERDPGRGDEITHVMRERVHRVLAVAAAPGHDTLVLGAWGCGAFGNAPEVVAELFREALDGDFRGQFATVVFAVLDEWSDRRNIGPFERRCGNR